MDQPLFLFLDGGENQRLSRLLWTCGGLSPRALNSLLLLASEARSRDSETNMPTGGGLLLTTEHGAS